MCKERIQIFGTTNEGLIACKELDFEGKRIHSTQKPVAVTMDTVWRKMFYSKVHSGLKQSSGAHWPQTLHPCSTFPPGFVFFHHTTRLSLLSGVMIYWKHWEVSRTTSVCITLVWQHSTEYKLNWAVFLLVRRWTEKSIYLQTRKEQRRFLWICSPLMSYKCLTICSKGIFSYLK